LLRLYILQVREPLPGPGRVSTPQPLPARSECKPL
jgi:hypothetical protein